MSSYFSLLRLSVSYSCRLRYYLRLGILLVNQDQVADALPLKDEHPGVLLGAFDTSDDHYDGFDDGELLFGIHQNPYLQGYLPIPILAWKAYTNQNLMNHLVETGPDFVETSPSEKQQTCQAKHFKVCKEEVTSEANEMSTPVGAKEETASLHSRPSTGAIVGVSVLAAALILLTTFLSYRVYKLKQYIRVLEKSGKDVPHLSGSMVLRGLFKDAEVVVNDAIIV